MHLLDSDTLTHLHAGHPKVVQRLRELSDPVVGTTIVTKFELLRGRVEFLFKAATGSELLRAQQLLLHTEELLSQLLVVPLDEDSAACFDRLRTTKGLRKIGRRDQLIASIALAHEATLVTRNVRHFFAFQELKVVNWVD